MWRGGQGVDRNLYHCVVPFVSKVESVHPVTQIHVCRCWLLLVACQLLSAYTAMSSRIRNGWVKHPDPLTGEEGQVRDMLEHTPMEAYQWHLQPLQLGRIDTAGLPCT